MTLLPLVQGCPDAPLGPPVLLALKDCLGTPGANGGPSAHDAPGSNCDTEACGARLSHGVVCALGSHGDRVRALLDWYNCMMPRVHRCHSVPGSSAAVLHFYAAAPGATNAINAPSALDGL